MCAACWHQTGKGVVANGKYYAKADFRDGKICKNITKYIHSIL